MIAPIAVIRAGESGVPLPVAVVDKARDAAAAHLDTVSRAHEAGVRIAMGTDSGVGPHGTNLEELPLMAAAGMSPADVLASTTSKAASLLGWGDTLGRIEPGFAADLLVVDGDPYDLDTLPARLRTVVQAGRPVVR
jgi:imidazolonepropionase-like amidohydrolase